MESTSEHWDELIADLYASAIDPAAGSRLPSQIGRLIGGTTTALWSMDTRTNTITGQLLTNLPVELVAAYADRFHAHDPWVFQPMPPDQVVDGASLIPNATLERSLFYNEFGRHAGTFHVAGATLPLGPAAEGVVGLLAVHRIRSHDGFDADDHRRLRHLLPHITRALQLRAQFATHAAAIEIAAANALLEALPHPALLLDGAATVIGANEAAEALASPASGLVLRSRPGRALTVAAATETRRLHAMVASVARGGTGGVIVLTLATSRVLAIVSPVPRALCARPEPGRIGVLLLLRQLDRSADRHVAHRAILLFGLTKAEAQVAAALCDGASPEAIAEARQVRISTIRTLLQRAQHKLGATNLRDLVRLLMLLRD